MTEHTKIVARLLDSATASGTRWWHVAAVAALGRGHYQAIYSRDGADLYLLRFWLSLPEKSHEADDKWESGDSCLLHYILRPDDATALHDHPWDFTTLVLSGGYIAERPHKEWTRRSQRLSVPKQRLLAGPTWREEHDLLDGDHVTLHVGDLHAIVHVQPSTWTLVTTGPRVTTWGFHPADEPWQSASDYLNRSPDAERENKP